MKPEALVRAALDMGVVKAAVIETAEIPLEPAFRTYCEDNVCGQYGVNYACPPACGSTEEMRRQLQSRKWGLLLKTHWELGTAMDFSVIKPAKEEHNRMTRTLINRLQGQTEGFMIGASACGLCTPCALAEGTPCRFPQQKASCMSAYCIFVRKLAERCGMEYDLGRRRVALFTMYIFDEK